MIWIPLTNNISYETHRITTERVYILYDVNRIQHSIWFKPGRIYQLLTFNILSHIITINHIKYGWVVYPQWINYSILNNMNTMEQYIIWLHLFRICHLFKIEHNQSSDLNETKYMIWIQLTDNISYETYRITTERAYILYDINGIYYSVRL